MRKNERQQAKKRVREDTAEKRNSMGTSLVVQGLRLNAANAGGPGSMPYQEIGFHTPQLRVCMLQLRLGLAK